MFLPSCATEPLRPLLQVILAVMAVVMAVVMAAVSVKTSAMPAIRAIFEVSVDGAKAVTALVVVPLAAAGDSMTALALTSAPATVEASDDLAAALRILYFRQYGNQF